MRSRLGHTVGHLRLPLDPVTRLYLWAWGQHAWMRSLIGALVAHREGAVVDVGANVGQTLIDVWLVDSSRVYVGFEPNPRCVSVLGEILAKNNLTQHRIVPIALWKEPALATLNMSRTISIDPGASLGLALRPNRPSRIVTAMCLPFDEIVPLLEIEKMALLKIDTEGSEFEVLLGMKSTIARMRPPIICEVLRRDASLDMSLYSNRIMEMWSLLAALDYQVFAIDKPIARSWTLTPISSFPLDAWTNFKWNKCDYLFLPRGVAVPVYQKGPWGRL
jgi:FkbM family methyltransferase